jgi:hypothetical protein
LEAFSAKIEDNNLVAVSGSHTTIVCDLGNHLVEYLNCACITYNFKLKKSP